MNKVVKKLLLYVYILMVLLITCYLFTYNQFFVSTIKNYTIFVSNGLEVFKNGSLIIVEKDINIVENGDKILFYNTYNAKNDILCQTVNKKEKTNDQETTFFLDNEKYLSSSYFIGKVNTALEIPLLGYIVKILSSTIGYLLFAVIPILCILLIQTFILIKKSSKPNAKRVI